MPKILIKELDKTEAGMSNYTNFSVVIPGPVGESEPEGVFDDNGIAIFTDQADFITKIGKIKAEATATEGHHATVTKRGTEETEIGTLTAEEFYRTYANKIYTAEEILKAVYDVSGKLTAKISTKYYKFTKIAEDAVYDSTADYVVIEPANVGYDACTILQMGNQIAYELLGLGYTVLYKKYDAVSDINDSTWWNALKDKSIYDFRYILTGCVNDTGDGETIKSTNTIISTLAATRGDCVALCDIPENVYTGANKSTAIANIKLAASGGNQYSAFFAPTVIYAGDASTVDTYENLDFPASFHYLACGAVAATKYPEWFAIAGYTRGISNKIIGGTKYKFGDAAVQTLQPRAGDGGAAVNLVINLRGAYYLWGNRTAFALSSGLVASHFLNIRQLCSTLKKQIYFTCRQLTFEPNSDLLWLNFCNAIRPTLENMVANQGIKDYRFEKKETKHKAKLFAAIRIIPIEAVEDFEISVALEDNFDNPEISITEELGEYTAE